MRCSKAKKLISSLIDGDLDKKQTTAIKQHVSVCSSCNKLWQDFSSISDSAKNLDEYEPPDYIWMKVRHRLNKGGLESSSDVYSRGRWFALPGFGFALASAALLLLIVGGILLKPHFFKDESALLQVNESSKYTLAKLEEAEMHYQKAIKALAEAVAVQERHMDPQVAEVFRINLETINASIAVCKQAVMQDPNNFESRNFLMAAYKEKANLLNKLMNLNGDSLNGNKDSTI